VVPAHGGANARAVAVTRDSRLHQAAAAFESLLVAHLLEAMTHAQLEQGLLGGGPGAEAWEGVFQEALAAKMSQNSPLGVARALEQQWSPQTEATAPHAPVPAPTTTGGRGGPPQVPVRRADEVLDRGARRPEPRSTD
jgi:Rod binding domain-containing protein